MTAITERLEQDSGEPTTEKLPGARIDEYPCGCVRVYRVSMHSETEKIKNTCENHEKQELQQLIDDDNGLNSEKGER